MSTEFRQRKPAEYAQILWRRKWMIALPAVAISLAVAYVVWRLPNVYQSTTLLTVRPSNLSEGIVPKLSDEDLTLRINGISQQVLSRTSLEGLIKSYNLYADERLRGEPMDQLVETMKKRDVQIELNTTRNDITNGFQLSFKGPRPDVAQHVTADLASKYINEQTKLSSEGAYQQLQFMEDQVRQAKDDLDAVDKQRIEYMTSHISSLPSTSQALVQQLTGLYEQEKSLVAEIGRLHDQQAMLSTQLAAAQKNNVTDKENLIDLVTDPKTTITWGDLSKQESDLESEIQAMRAQGLKDKFPDIVEKQQQLEGVKKRKQQMLDDQKEKIEERKKRIEARIDPSIPTLQGQIEFAKNEAARQQKFLDETRAQIGQLETRINSVPNTEVGLSALDRDYQTKKAAYDELLEKKNKASIAAEAAKAAQGESIQLIDPASLPEKPVAPKRPTLMIGGLALGLFVGLVFAAAFEVPRLLTVQTVEDARHYTSLPVLVSVPELLTPREVRRRKARRVMLAFASVAVTVFAVPALALLLKLSHVFDRIGT